MEDAKREGTEVGREMDITRGRIAELKQYVSELESRLSEVLRQPQAKPDEIEDKTETQLVPLAAAARVFGRDIRKEMFRLEDIIDRVEL